MQTLFIDGPLVRRPKFRSCRFDRFRVEFETGKRRPLQFATSNWFGTFYDGSLFEQEAELRVNSPSGAWRAGVDVARNFADLKEVSFHLPPGSLCSRGSGVVELPYLREAVRARREIPRRGTPAVARSRG